MMFFPRPNYHLNETDQCKKSDWKTLGHHRETNPAADLIGVVRTGHKEEQPRKRIPCREGNPPQPGAFSFQIAQCYMDGEITSFTDQKHNHREADLLLSIRGRSVQRVIDVVRDPRCKPPVVEAVLYDTLQRHRPV